MLAQLLPCWRRHPANPASPESPARRHAPHAATPTPCADAGGYRAAGGLARHLQCDLSCAALRGDSDGLGRRQRQVADREQHGSSKVRGGVGLGGGLPRRALGLRSELVTGCGGVCDRSPGAGAPPILSHARLTAHTQERRGAQAPDRPRRTLAAPCRIHCTLGRRLGQPVCAAGGPAGAGSWERHTCCGDGCRLRRRCLPIHACHPLPCHPLPTSPHAPGPSTTHAQELSAIGDALKRHEGCNLYGWLQVARVAGNIHFAVRPEALFLSMNAAEIMEVRRACCWACWARAGRAGHAGLRGWRCPRMHAADTTTHVLPCCPAGAAAAAGAAARQGCRREWAGCWSRGPVLHTGVSRACLARRLPLQPSPRLPPSFAAACLPPALQLHPDASKLNVSHIIHELRFGPAFPGQARWACMLG